MSTPSAAAPRHKLASNLLVALALAGLGVVAFTCLASALQLRAQWPPEADTFYLPPAKALHVLSFGHNELAADLLHARANVYFGTQIHAKMPTKWLSRYLHAAMDLDPQFRRLYLSGATMLVYNGQRMVPDMILAANVILERGRKAFPFDWELPFQLGFNLMYELPNDADPDDPRIPTWRQQGVEILRQAALFEGVPYYVPSIVARMLTKNGSQDLAIQHLEQAYAVATSEEARAQIGIKLATLRGRRFSEDIAEKRLQFSDMINSRFPNLPEAFSLVTGPRITSLGITALPPGHGTGTSGP